jgi:Matrixin
LVAAFLVVAATAAATLPRADASDVPVYSSCWPGDQTGYYHWEVDANGNFNHYIEINECALERLGAGPQDRERVIAHELGHAAGLSHSSDPSDTMYPVILMTGT